MNNDKLKYYITTYSQFSHNFLIATLSTNETEYHYEQPQNEEVFSRFVVVSDINVYNTIKQLIESNNGTALSIEYGAY
jgi:hypothetical protein